MNCIHLINYFRQGGAENVAYNYIKVLKSLEVDSTIIGKPYSKTYESRFSKLATIEYFITPEVLGDTNYIFIHSNQCLLRLLKYYRIIKKNNIRVIYIQHLNYNESKFWLLSKLINFLCTDFIQITPITSTLIDRYIKIKKHFIVNFYIAKYEKTQWPLIRSEIRNKYNIPQDSIVVSFSGIFKPGKNIGKFIELAKSMQDDPKYKFLVIGDGPEADIIKAYTGNNIIWVGRVNDVEQYLIASDIYAFMSLYEMMPMALIEAINTNKHIIAYNTDVNNFLLDNHVFHDINKHVIYDSIIPSGEDLKHYDEKYAYIELSKLVL
jgi:glycosyltransferase involved in cell wall biosynthesis